MLKKSVLWAFVAGLLLITLAACQKEPTLDPESSLPSVVSENSVTSIETSPSSQMESPVEEVPSEDVSSQAPEASSKVVNTSPEPVSSREVPVESNEVISSMPVVEEPSEPGSFDAMFLTFKPECITTKEEMTSLSFFSEPISSSVDSIHWGLDEGYDYTMSIVLKRGTKSETLQAIRAALLKREDLLKIRYAVRTYIDDPITSSEATSSSPTETVFIGRQEAYDFVLLTFREKNITSKSEMAQPAYFPELNAEWISKIEWTFIGSNNVDQNLSICFKTELMDEENREKIRAALLEREDISKISYGEQRVFSR